MSEQEQVAPSEATPEVVENPETPEAVDNTEGQTSEGQAAEGDAEQSEAPEEKSESQRRRERDKALKQRLKDENEALRRDLDALKERLNDTPAVGEPPKESDYPDYTAYQAALTAHETQKAMANYDRARVERDISKREEAEKELQRQIVAQKVAELEEQKVEARAKYADFDQVFEQAFIPPQVAEMVLDSDQPADVAYYLGKHQALARQIASLPPLAAARELGRIEATLSAPKPRTQSNAPPPIRPVQPAAKASKNTDKMSPDEYEEWRASGGTFYL